MVPGYVEWELISEEGEPTMREGFATVGCGLLCSECADHVPSVKAVGGLREREADVGIGLAASNPVTLEVDFLVIGETYFGLAVFSESVHGDEGLGEPGNAAYASDENFVTAAVRVGSEDREIAHAGDLAAGALDAGHGVV